jgi:hypothetical protein
MPTGLADEPVQSHSASLHEPLAASRTSSHGNWPASMSQSPSLATASMTASPPSRTFKPDDRGAEYKNRFAPVKWNQ